jgi:beta-RFAP synthase
MLAEPGLRMRAEPSDRFQAVGPLAERVAPFARRWAEFHRTDLPAIRLETLAAPPEHVGLGLGTQLGLTVATLLSAAEGLPFGTPEELAASVGRGARSAVGAYGFHFGGCIFERGKTDDERLAPLDCRLPIPETWRFVLVRPAAADLAEAGLAGPAEAAAFERLRLAPAPERTAELIRLAREELAPALAAGDFSRFADGLTRFGRLSGELFAPIQGGPYRGKLLAALVERMTALGARGVGQSSWGPTLFALAPDMAAAAALAEALRAEAPALARLEIATVAPDNTGVRLMRRPIAESAAAAVATGVA